MQPLLWQQLNHLTDHLINVSETVNQPTYCEQLPVGITSTTYSPQGPLEILQAWGEGGAEFQRQFEAYKQRTRTIDVSETNLKCLSDICHYFFFYFDDKSRDKKEINQHGRVRNKVFLQHIYYVTDDVILQRSV